MNRCPDKNNPRYKELVDRLGEIEAYRTWLKNDGDLSSIPESDILASKQNKSNIFQQIGKLQTEGLIGKRESKFTYRVNPDDFNPTKVEEKAYRAAQMLNEKSGKELVQPVKLKEGWGIKIDPEVQKIIDKLSPQDKKAYTDYLVENLYGSKDHPTTTELLNNTAKLSKDLKRDDMTDMARLIYKYLYTNPDLTIDLDNGFEDPDMQNAKAYYSRSGNVISFDRSKFGSGTLEKEAETVLHEFVHALTEQPWRKGNLSPEEKNFKDTVDSYYNHFKAIGDKSRYEFSNAQEFLASALNESGFKNYLKSLETPTKESFFKSFMNGIIKAFLRLFGIKPDEKIISKIDPANFEQNLLKATSDYLSQVDPKSKGNILKEPGRNYGLSFAVTAEQDFMSEREKLKDKFTPEMRDKIEGIVKKSINAIKSFSSRIKSTIPESEEEFKSIFRQFRKLEEPEYNVDQVGFFFDFTSDIGAVVNAVHDKIDRLYGDESIKDPDFKLQEYEHIISAVRNFDPILEEIKSVKKSLSNIGAKEFAKDVDNIIIKRANIETLYSEGIFPLVTNKFVDILDSASRRSVEISRAKIDDLERSLELARKNGNQSRVRERQRQIDEEKEQMNRYFVQNGDKIQSWLRGEMGDSGIFSTWLLAGVSNKHPLVAGVSKYIRDTRNEASPRILEIQNSMQSQVDKYSKETGRSMNNISEFNAQLLHTYETIKGKNQEGQYETEKKYSLLNPFNGEHIKELQKFSRDIQHLREIKEDLENNPNPDLEKINQTVSQIKDIKEQQRKFKRDYMEQEYKPEVHEALDMIYKNLGGFTAHDYIRDKYDTISDIEAKIDQSNNPDEIDRLYDQLDDANFELKRLSSLYDKSSDSKEHAVAQLLKERSKLLNKYSDFTLTEKGKIKFETDMARLKRRFEKNEITKDQYERELENNTVTELSKDYWDKKKAILAEMHDILNKLGAKTDKNEEIAKLYSDMEDIVKAHRDSAGIINGREMTEKELIDVKNTEEAIEKAKDKIPNIMGLTKPERIELYNLYGQLSNISERMMFPELHDDMDALEAQKEDINFKISQIEYKKKKLDKKLLNRYLNVITKLSELDESSVTGYYQDELLDRTEQEKWKVDVTKIPDQFVYKGIRYEKSGDDWSSVTTAGRNKAELSKVQDAYRSYIGEANLLGSDWYKNNHIKRFKWQQSEYYRPDDPDTYGGEWKEVEEPTYAWRQTRPANKNYVIENQPSAKYKKRVFKEEYKNPNYKLSVTGEILPKLEGAKDDRFINKEYFRLKNSQDPKDKSTFQMLSYLTDMYLGSQESIPFSRRPGYDLPSLRKSTVERFLSKSLSERKDDLFEHMGQIARLWKDDVVRNPQDQDILFGYHDDTSGIVPMKFLGKIDYDDQSIDLPRVMLAFKLASIEREQLIKALPFATAARDIVSSTNPVVTKNGAIQTIKSKFLPKNTGLAKRSSSNNAALQINEIIKTEIYGEKMKDTPVTKLVNNTLGLGAKLLLGFNFVSSIQNYANAFTQSMMETESNISGNFTFKDFATSNKIYWSNVHNFMSDIGKYGNKSLITQMFDYFGGLNMKIIAFDNKSLAHSEVREFTKSLSVPNQITEHMLNYQLGMAVMLNYRVKAKVDGKEVMEPIMNAFTLDDGKLKVKDGYTVTEEDRKAVTSKLNSSVRRINGEYGDGILAQKYVLGQMALFMNRYAIPFIVKRYGARQFDIQDGVREEGYWRLLGKTILRDIKGKTLPILGGWRYYTKEEKNAIVRASTEFGFTVMFFALMNALGGSDDKHLKDNAWAANYAIYALKGIQQQNEAFMPVPGVGFDDLLRKVQNPFPILGKIKNAVSLIQDGSHALYYEMGLPGVDHSDVFYTRAYGWHKPGDLKVTSDLEKLLAIPYRVFQYTNPDQAVKNADIISRIK